MLDENEKKLLRECINCEMLGMISINDDELRLVCASGIFEETLESIQKGKKIPVKH